MINSIKSLLSALLPIVGRVVTIYGTAFAIGAITQSPTIGLFVFTLLAIVTEYKWPLFSDLKDRNDK